MWYFLTSRIYIRMAKLLFTLCAWAELCLTDNISRINRTNAIGYLLEINILIKQPTHLKKIECKTQYSILSAFSTLNLGGCKIELL